MSGQIFNGRLDPQFNPFDDDYLVAFAEVMPSECSHCDSANSSKSERPLFQAGRGLYGDRPDWGCRLRLRNNGQGRDGRVPTCAIERPLDGFAKLDRGTVGIAVQRQLVDLLLQRRGEAVRRGER